jgi:cytochrome c
MRALIISLLVWVCLYFVPSTSHAAVIHDAAQKGDVAAIVAALDAGVNVNESDGTATPLFYAISRRHFEAAKLLIERGADVNKPSALGALPLAPAAGQGKIEFIKLLLDHGANPNSVIGSETVLHIAVKRGCLDCVEALVEAGADVNAQTTDSQNRTPVHIAKLLGFPEVAEYLIAHGVVLPKPAPISTMLAAADVEKGRLFFQANCSNCHLITQEGHKMGPTLWNVVGRDIGSVSEMSYSEALKAWEGVWTYEDLNVFLYGPTLTAPGTRMEIRGVPETERINLIAYLRTLSDKPLPLP